MKIRTPPAAYAQPSPDTCESSRLSGDQLPEVVFVEDLAGFLGCTPKAIRGRVTAGQLPKPFKVGKRLAWLRETIESWLLERSRAATRPPVQITITSHTYKGNTGLQAVFKMIVAGKETKATELVPKGHDSDRDQAKVWAAEQVERILPKMLAKAGLDINSPEKPQQKEDTKQEYKNPKSATLFKVFVEDRFIPEEVLRWKASSQEVYLRLMRQHLLPHFGGTPLGAIDEDLISRFEGKIMKFKPNFRNLLLARLKKIMGFARKLKYIDHAPLIERHAVPRAVIETYTVDEIAIFIEVAKGRGLQANIIAHLCADLGLRAGEICGLPWSSVKLDTGEIFVARNSSRGSGNTPKGTVATLKMSKALHALLLDQRKREPIGPLVVYRKGRMGDWVPYDQQRLWLLLTSIAREAGLGQVCSARFMRHVCITALNDLGASPGEIQAHARHALLSTTEGYLHPRQAPASRRAMVHLDNSRGETEGDSDPVRNQNQTKKAKKG